MSRIKEQKLIDICFEIAMTIHSNPDFVNQTTQEQLAEWVRRQLEICGFKTIPIGASWGVLDEK